MGMPNPLPATNHRRQAIQKQLLVFYKQYKNNLQIPINFNLHATLL